MKKTQDKQADKQTKQPNYPKVHTQAHPNAYKVPIADLLNPDCPISAGVTDKLRKELLELQAKGRKYAYIDSYKIEYKDIADPTNPASKAVNETARQNIKRAMEKRGINNSVIYDNDIALDPNNPISTTTLQADLRKNLEMTRFIYKSLIRVLSEEKINFIFDNAATFWDKLEIELQKIQKTQNETITGLIELCLDENGNPKPDNILEKAITAAGYKPAEERTSTAPQLPQAVKGNANKLDMPLDVVNTNLWNNLGISAKTGQFRFDLPAEYDPFDVKTVDAAKRGKEPALILYGIDFSAVDSAIDRALDQYDKRVYIAIGGLWHYCIDILKMPTDKVYVTAKQIYYAMGYNGNPGKADKKKIYDAISKMNTAILYLNNYYEMQTHKNRVTADYKSNLLHCEMITAKVNGVVADMAFRIVGEPPLITFARQRNQITTINRSLLTAEINKNNTSMLIEDFFLIHISLLKNGSNNMNNTNVLYSTIFDYAKLPKKGNNAAKYQSRAKVIIKKLLDHYTAEGFIRGYNEKQLKGGQGIELLIDQTRIAPPKQ